MGSKPISELHSDLESHSRMRTLLAALTALMLFATPVVAGEREDAIAAYKAGNYQKTIRYPGSYRQPRGNREDLYPKERGAL